MKTSTSQLKLSALATLSLIGAATMTIATHQNAAIAGEIQPVLRPSIGQIDNLKLLPTWKISGEVNVTAGKYASLNGVTCNQMTISVSSVEQVPVTGGLFTYTTPKFTYPSKAVKMQSNGASSPSMLKCKYTITGTKYVGEAVNFNINGPANGVSFTNKSVIIPALQNQAVVNFDASLFNIG